MVYFYFSDKVRISKHCVDGGLSDPGVAPTLSQGKSTLEYMQPLTHFLSFKGLFNGSKTL